ncbi:MAG: hypothetical protein JO113_02685 [Candidatus Eremiobacteraeota bacterium]|nr:hypothetical protein [Candidatus Eremiobacteraeota bacterium]
MAKPVIFAALAALLVGCGGATFAVDKAPPVEQSASALRATKVYQPLAVGDYWTYTCNHSFAIANRITKTVAIGKRTTYAFSLQIPSSPTKSARVVELLSNDTRGNTWIYGYLLDGKIRSFPAREIVSFAPVKNEHFDYPRPKHGTVSRLFKTFEYTNKTPLGVFWVAAYFESRGTHNYGYSLGRGVMEEDHGPHYQYDCLIERYVLHK